MKRLHGRRTGRRQRSKIEQSLAVDDSSALEPDDPASAAALATHDRTGWPPHPSERRDFYHRIRNVEDILAYIHFIKETVIRG
jgi:hypothetical protein